MRLKNTVAIVTGATGSIGAAVCGNLLVMLQGGTLDHDDAVRNMRLFSREAPPRIQNLEVAGDSSTEEIELVQEKAQRGELAAAQ